MTHEDSQIRTEGDRMVIKAICGIRINDYDAIALKVAEHKDGTEPSLFISIEDGGLESGASFFFDNVHEAITFSKRMLEQLEAYLPA